VKTSQNILTSICCGHFYVCL